MYVGNGSKRIEGVMVAAHEEIAAAPASSLGFNEVNHAESAIYSS